jgi:N6-adenosine-specific RNA methylase IME4
MNDLIPSLEENRIPTIPGKIVPFIKKKNFIVNTFRKMLKIGKFTKEDYHKILEKGQEQGEILLEAKISLGEILSKQPKGTRGTGGNQFKSAEFFNTENSAKNSRMSLYEDLGLNPKEAALYQKLADNPSAIEKAKLQARENKDIVNVNLVNQIILQEITEQAQKDVIEKLENLKMKKAKKILGVYDVIIIDPPWPVKKILRHAAPKQVEWDYPTMSVDEIINLELPMSENCHIFLWTTQKFLPHALKIIEYWNLKYCCTFVWKKAKGFQVGKLPQFNCEFCIYCKKGKPVFIDLKDFKTCFEGTQKVHSTKPKEFYELVKRVTAGRRLDMFGRNRHEGFEIWGLEAGK